MRTLAARGAPRSEPQPRRVRLDVWLHERGLVESRQKARALIMAGRVLVSGVASPKPGSAVARDARIELLAGPSHVGRGALKLEGALDAFGIEPAGRVALDVGASTGGFTQTLLARGAARVFAVDVGRAQLHEKLRSDPRVVALDRLNARKLSRREIHEPCALAVMDVSFISVLKILPALPALLGPQADVVTLVKPQFEVGRSQVGRGGIVSDPALHLEALSRVARAARDELGYAVLGACASPIAGAEGNREFFLHLRHAGCGLEGAALEAALRRAAQP